MLINLSVLLTFLSVFIISLIIFILPYVEKNQVNKSLEQINIHENISKNEPQEASSPQIFIKPKPFAERVFMPTSKFLLGIGRKITPLGITDYLKKQLIYAGNPRDLNIDKLFIIKVLISITVFILLLLMVLFSFIPKSKAILGGLFLIPTVFFLPDIWLIHQAEKRQKEIRLALPDTIDLLSISVEAGLGFDSAIAKVIKNYKGALAQELSQMLTEIQMGATRREALKDLTKRSNVSELHTFISALVQADVLGISICKVLRTQAREMRLKRRQKAEEIAQKAPVKIVFPLVLCIMPAILVVILGPSFIRIISALSNLVNK